MKLYYSIIFLSILGWQQLTAQTINDKKFPIAIKFVSYCCGVPDKKAIIDYVKCFEKQYNVNNITLYKSPQVGKEGEYHLVFPLSELNSKLSEKFIEGIEKIKSTSQDQGTLLFRKNFNLDTSGLSRIVIQKASFFRD